MTDKDVEKASPDAKPLEGEILLYIDWQGNKIYGAPQHPKHAPKAKTSK